MTNRTKRYLVLVIALAPIITATPLFLGEAAVAADSGARADVTRAQFETRQQKRFFKADQDANNLVSKQEFSKVHPSVDAGKLAKRFARIDTNRDGSVDATELSAMLDRRFKRIDADKNGVLSASERPVVHKPASVENNG